MISLLRKITLFGLFLFSVGLPAAAQEHTGVVSTDKLVAGTFANDATFRTDYYFTQGVSVNVILPGLQKSPVNKILLRAPGADNLHYGIKGVYDGFTPLSILDAYIRYNDRPYASYIYTSHYHISTNTEKKSRLTAGLEVGFMGPATGAGRFQAKVHEWLDSPKPQGWQYQVQNDVVLGYTAGLEKQLFNLSSVFELIGQGQASLGTLYTYGAGGLMARFGKMAPYFQQLGITAKENRKAGQKFQFYAQGGIEGRVVGYNATLQGGLFSRSPYTLSASQINRGVVTQRAGLVCAYGGISFESSVVWKSPEFENARRHKWMHFELKFAI